MNAPRQRRFPTTRWSLVDEAAKSQHERDGALQQICETYWYPVYVFIRRRGYNADAAADLTQAFFASLIETRALRRADANRGRFRNFLLASVEHFLSNERDRQNALKRGGKVTHVALDLSSAERKMKLEGYHDTPERSFARSWALTLVERSLHQLRRELTEEGRIDDYDRYRWLLCDDPAPGDYATLARETGLGPGALRLTVHRLRTRFRSIVRGEIERLVGPDSVDQEIRFLIDAISR